MHCTEGLYKTTRTNGRPFKIRCTPQGWQRVDLDKDDTDFQCRGPCPEGIDQSGLEIATTVPRKKMFRRSADPEARDSIKTAGLQ